MKLRVEIVGSGRDRAMMMMLRCADFVTRRVLAGATNGRACNAVVLSLDS